MTTHTSAIFTLWILLLNFYSCNPAAQETNPDFDYLIFGHFYGFCVGEGCIETYKLTDSTLFEDSEDDYLHTDFNFIPLENKRFEQTKDLIDYFPPKLFKEAQNTFGCPDCADQGGVFVELSKNGKTTRWRFDQYKSNVPSYLHSFIDKVNEKIALINNN